MAHRLRLVGIVAVAFFTSAVFAQGQSAGVGSAPASVLQQYFGYQHSASYQAGGSSTRYVYPPTPKAQDSGQQQSNNTEGQSQSGNQNQGMAGSQNRNQTQNQNGQGQKKEEAPPEKPSYLTYTVKKKSLEEQVKTGKALPVEFKSVPAGATITVDGYFLGHTPATKQIPVGKHLVTITKWGYQSWSQNLDVASGKKLGVNPSLHKDW